MKSPEGTEKKSWKNRDVPYTVSAGQLRNLFPRVIRCLIRLYRLGNQACSCGFVINGVALSLADLLAVTLLDITINARQF